MRRRYLGSTNDIFTDAADVSWVREVLGESRVSLRPGGAHCGGLADSERQQEIVDALKPFAPTRS